jgi:quinoprotein glucose dehydrogenase
MLFVLDRRTGVPLYPVEERPVPQSGVAGEVTSPTQPFSSLPSFSPLDLPTLASTATTWQRSKRNSARCQELMAGLIYQGIYTPPSERGSIIFPGNIGGVNWGGATLDPSTNILYANTNRQAYSVQLLKREPNFGVKEQGIYYYLIPYTQTAVRILALAIVLTLIFALIRRWRLAATCGVLGLMLFGFLLSLHFRAQRAAAYPIHAAFGYDHSSMFHTPYELLRQPIVDYDHMPCVSPPWGAIAAINLDTGLKVWDKTLGTMYSEGDTGSTNLGGPVVIPGGLVFTAGTKESIFRAFDAATGNLVWQSPLPVPAQSTPMSYTVGGKQFIVIADGGHGLFGTKTGDSVIAFAIE